MYFVPHFGHAKVFETSIWTPCFQISAKTLLKLKIFLTNKVAATGMYNYTSAQVRVPSDLNIEAYLTDYEDKQIIHFLEFSWSISFNRECPPVSTEQPHSSGRDCPESLNFTLLQHQFLTHFLALNFTILC